METQGITKMDKATVNALARELAEVVATWAAGKGLNVKPKAGTFDPTLGTWNAKLELSLKVLPNGMTAEQVRFAQVCHFYGVSPSDYGRVIVVNGADYRLTGFMNGSRFEVLGARAKDGKTFKFPRAVLRQLLPASAADCAKLDK